jgi:glycosyltransferase involved in cell wall biosynthesis
VRILTVAACAFPTRQGSQVLIRQAAEELAARGHEVVIAAYATGEKIACAVPIVRAPRLPGAGRLRAGPSLAKPWLDAALARTVARLRARRRPDVIHAHNVEGAVVALAAADGVPVIYHAHGLLEAELPTYLPRPLRPLAARAGRAADRALPARAAATITLTQTCRAALVEGGADPGRVHAVPPGIKVEKVDPARARRFRERVCGAGEGLVVYTGNADAYQGLRVVLDAAVHLARARPFRLVLALTGGPRRLPAEAARRGLSARVTFLDASWEETGLLLAACDAAVVPRPDGHGFPMKLLNVLALGAPAVVHTASAHGLRDGETALLAQDAAGFARALDRLLRDRDLARRIGAAGRDYALKQLDAGVLAGRIEWILGKAAGH